MRLTDSGVYRDLSGDKLATCLCQPNCYFDSYQCAMMWNGNLYYKCDW